ncbi:class I SAM-dependent methyltransferase [Cochleicola gelatinilyticus]|uniref:SAM-dependent methyltransferase n=1 Tax=Cochleicola gelatinilyticus TaxID=1763537 RepID=A0A167GUV4_9FLAO|nr:class I SAM-dependent methyltransferase [Cochleicola gelatinilyticus]OAB77930.1 SAM-dependent methyltransferase [Cochleicola gelatinilyticus]
MNKKLLSATVQEFIINYNDPLEKLAFAGSPFKEITTQELIQQIESRKKTVKKLPSYYNTEGVYYPPKLNIEQTSSEETAAYKATIVAGNNIADLTGGFGVDSLYFGKNFRQVDHYEHNEALSEIAAHNFIMLNARTITCFAQDGLSGIENKKYDVIYIDPSRRHNTKGKVFFLRDCEPNIPEVLDTLFNHTSTILLKTSPMLDLSIGLEELSNVEEIHVVAVSNEVKELVWLLKKDCFNTPLIKTINYTNEVVETFNFKLSDTSETIYDNPKRFLYEPNTAILKSGAFHLLSDAFKVKKLHQHSHLYTSEALREFPGRRFSIDKVVNYSKKEMRGLHIDKANISIRNFPESVATLRKKWNIKDGGELYLFFTTTIENQKILLVCSKL